MSKRIDWPSVTVTEEQPPLVAATPIGVDAVPVSVILDEDLSFDNNRSNPIVIQDAEAYLEMEEQQLSTETPANEVVPAPLELEELSPDHTLQQRWRKNRLLFTTATILWLVGLTLLVTVGIYYTSLKPTAPIETTPRELCSRTSMASSPSSDLWNPAKHLDIGNFRVVAMNNDTIVGVKGNTMVETRSMVTSHFGVQYFDAIRSMTLADNDVLVVSVENDHAMVLTRSTSAGGNDWEASHAISKTAKHVDSNGEDVVLWTGTDLHLYDTRRKRLQHIASLQGVIALKLSQDGKHILVATETEVRTFRKQRSLGRWIAQESIWFESDLTENGRETQGAEEEGETEAQPTDELNLSTNSDGSIAAIVTSGGRVLLYEYVSLTWESVGGGGEMDAANLSMSKSGKVIAVATSSGRILVLELDEDFLPHSFVVTSEIPVDGDVREMYWRDDDSLQVVVDDTFILYESVCSKIAGG